ncbi:hypothetical protein LUX39_08015 [Actinomadura madurae]|nr:hypothetical protein [Actinomadura madurae]MCQ0013742.1 hypothetical protein [Actinomadura madurae]
MFGEVALGDRAQVLDHTGGHVGGLAPLKRAGHGDRHLVQPDHPGEEPAQVGARGQFTGARGGHQFFQKGLDRQETLRTAALEGELGRDLPPAVPDLAEHHRIRHVDPAEMHLVEVVLTVERDDRTALDALRAQVDDELAEPGVPVLGVQR